MRPPLFGITGWKNSGKTTLAAALIRELTRRGYSVTALKHAHKSFEIDHPGRDSFKLREAGAARVVVSSPNRWAIMRELRGEPEAGFEELLAEDAGTLAPSPADALGHDADGFADFIDAAGHTLGGSPVAPPGSEYLRRWSIDSLPGSRNVTWVLQVLVIDLRSRAATRFTSAKSAKAF